MYGSITDHIMRKLSKLEEASEIEYTFKSLKLDQVLDIESAPRGDPLVIKSKNGSESYTLKNDREKVGF